MGDYLSFLHPLLSNIIGASLQSAYQAAVSVVTHLSQQAL